MKIKQIYTEKFLDRISDNHYLLHKEVEEWTPRDWDNWTELTIAIMNLIKLEKKE